MIFTMFPHQNPQKIFPKMTNVYHFSFLNKLLKFKIPLFEGEILTNTIVKRWIDANLFLKRELEP